MQQVANAAFGAVPGGMINKASGVAGLDSSGRVVSPIAADLTAGTLVPPGSGGSSKSLVSVLGPVYRQISLLSYGAKCDGTTDDTAAINAWLANATDAGNGPPANVELVAPAGICVFTSTLHNPAAQQAGNVTLAGAGVGATTFLYEGTSTTIDLINIGDGANPQFNWSIRSFKVQSATKMTAGTALHIRGLVRSSIGDVVLDGQDGNGNLWNGLWLDQVDSIMSWGNNFATGQNDAIRLNGGPLGAADFGMMGWKVSSPNGYPAPAVGVHIGGGFGGFNCDGGSDIIGNTIGVLIDNALYSVTNREFAFGPMCGIDSSKNIGVKINDTLSHSGDLYVNFSGGWIASSGTNNLEIETGINGHLIFSGGTIFNALGNGVYDLSNMVQSYSGVQFRQNGRGSSGGYGFSKAGGTNSIMLVGNNFEGNTSGATSGVTQVIAPYANGSGGAVMGARIALTPDGSGNSALIPATADGTTNEGSSLSWHQTGGLVDKLYVGNTNTNPTVALSTAAAWTTDTTKCGSISGSTGCAILYNSSGAARYLPVFGN
ncbi:MAG: glycosyl hydrolase family 28-related protein [Gluconacetobacter sp.]